VRLSAGAGLAIAAAAPLVSQLSWEGVPSLVRSYLTPDPLAFAFFPWAAFVAFGLSAGSVLRLLQPEQTERAVQWAGLIGFGLVLAGQYFSNLPYSLYTKSEFWLDSPWQVLIKLGAILLVLAFAYVWARQPVAQTKWSWVRQFGTTSLLVYWVHVELVYGRWFWFWKENLTVAHTALAALAVVVLMLGLSVLKTRWLARRNWNLAARWNLLWTRRAPAQ
jgi:fucose 4-O-acetylase-like acetyltransferase